MQKAPLLQRGWYFYFKQFLFKCGNSLHALRFQIGSFILVNNGTLSQLIYLWNQLRQSFVCFFKIFRSSEISQSITHRFSVISVVQSARRRLTNSFYRWFVVCHFLFFSFFIIFKGLIKTISYCFYSICMFVHTYIIRKVQKYPQEYILC